MKRTVSKLISFIIVVMNCHDITVAMTCPLLCFGHRWANRRAKILIEVAWIRKVKQLVESSLTLQEKVMGSAGISAICVIIFDLVEVEGSKSLM